VFTAYEIGLKLLLFSQFCLHPEHLRTSVRGGVLYSSKRVGRPSFDWGLPARVLAWWNDDVAHCVALTDWLLHYTRFIRFIIFMVIYFRRNQNNQLGGVRYLLQNVGIKMIKFQTLIPFFCYYFK